MIERRSKKDTTGIIRPDPQTSISKDHQFPSLSESLPHPRPLVNSFILEKLKDLLKLIQGGITCEAIDEPRKSSKAIDKRVIINFRDKNVVIERNR